MKNVNWKELIIDHIEKGVLGLAGLIILVGLATTSWGTYDKRPSEFAEKVKTGEQNFQEGIWPEKQSADFEAEDPGLQVPTGARQSSRVVTGCSHTPGMPWLWWLVPLVGLRRRWSPASCEEP